MTPLICHATLLVRDYFVDFRATRWSRAWCAGAYRQEEFEIVRFRSYETPLRQETCDRW